MSREGEHNSTVAKMVQATFKAWHDTFMLSSTFLNLIRFNKRRKNREPSLIFIISHFFIAVNALPILTRLECLPRRKSFPGSWHVLGPGSVPPSDRFVV